MTTSIAASNLVIRLRPLCARVEIHLAGLAVDSAFTKKWGPKIRAVGGTYGACRGLDSRNRHVELPVSGEGMDLALQLLALFPVTWISAQGLTSYAYAGGSHFSVAFKAYVRRSMGASEEVLSPDALRHFVETFEKRTSSAEAQARRQRELNDKLSSEAAVLRRRLEQINAAHGNALRDALEALTNLAVNLAPAHPAVAKARATLDSIVGEERQLQLTIAERESRITA